MADYKIGQNERIIEAVLFAAGYPVTYNKLSDILSLSVSEVKKCVKAFAEYYNSEEIMRGIQLVTYDDACQLCSREEYAEYIKEALGIRRGGTLSNSSLEVLALIAYHQPVTRAYVEQIRGVDCSYAISSLLDKGLIDVKGRLDVPGKPYLYVTTDDFLRCFGLESLSQLPPAEYFSDMARDEQLTLELGEGE